MNNKMLKKVLTIIFFGIAVWLFSTSVKGAYVSITPSTTSATPGQSVGLTISSDCTGKVSLSASNGTISTSSIWVEGGASASVTVGNSGTTTVTATPVDMSDANGSDVKVGASSASISISTDSSGNSNGGSSGSNSGTSNNGSGNTDSTKTPTNTGTTTKKSNNANLTNLGIKPNDFSGFKQNTTSYSVTVPENVESVEVYATKADSKSTVSGTGKRTLKKGANALAVTVTAEDGTKKTYTINVTRQGEEEKPEENTTPDGKTEEMPEETQNKKGLSGLTIGDLKLTPSFDTEVYEYKIKYIGEDTKLSIDAQPTDENYVVDITGNEDLKEGENLITILVSDKEGNNIATYQVTVEKSLVDEEAIAKEQAEKDKQQKMIIIGAIVAVVIIAIIIFLIIRHRRNKEWAEDYSGIPFAGINEEDIEDEFDDENTQTQNYIENEPSKDNLRQDYLNGYDDSYSDDYEDEKPKRKKGKGKRFK